MAKMRSTAGVLVLCAGMLSTAFAEPGVVKMDLMRTSPRMVKRDALQPVTLGNAIQNNLYYVNATIGTPPQTVALQIDTGSSDVWMFGPDVYASCEECVGGYYDPNNSSTYTPVTDGQNAFSIQYVTPGSGVNGSYFQDTFTIGGLNLKNLTMAVASNASATTTGIMGVGFDTDESIVSNENATPYQNLIDTLVVEGLIGTRAYSLYLDDLEASTGAILFGGYDTAKFTGDLTALPIQPDAQSGTLSSFTVVWSLLAVTDNTGTTTVGSQDFPLPAVLDSGTTLTVIPQDMFQELADYFGAVNNQDYGYLVPCTNANVQGSIDYQFGGTGGPIISVPFSELAIPLYDEKGNAVTFRDGKAACSFGFSPAQEDSPILFGDTFLRSAYVVYDLDALQVYIANSAWNVSASNIQTVNPVSTSGSEIYGTPITASSAVGASVTQTATGNAEAPGLKATTSGATASEAESTGVSSLNGGKTSLIGLGVHGITSTASSQATGTGSSASPTSSSGAATNVLPGPGLSGVWLLLGTSLAIIFGGALVVAM